MNPLTTCPEPGELKQLLDGVLGGSRAELINAHLESCSYCQQTLESLVAGKESWLGTIKSLREEKRPPAPGLRRLLEESLGERKDEQTEPEVKPTDDFPPDFLDASADPAHLGRLGHYEVIEIIGRGGM